jgi:hypothetical protein
MGTTVYDILVERGCMCDGAPSLLDASLRAYVDAITTMRYLLASILLYDLLCFQSKHFDPNQRQNSSHDVRGLRLLRCMSVSSDRV